MKWETITPSATLLTSHDTIREMVYLCELAARTCYRSEDKMGQSALLQRCIRRGHESVIEHGSATVRFEIDRSCSHQLVRHRLGAYSQESQRYVDYAKRPLRMIQPDHVDSATWTRAIDQAVDAYLALRETAKPEDARSVLPNATATVIVATYNFRQWRHVFGMRALNSHAQDQIRGVTQQALSALVVSAPEIFGDLLEES